MIKLFQFPPFETWNKHKREFKETIGEFTCVFHPTCWRLNSSITRYECAIASCDNPTNIYVSPVVSWAFECDSTDTKLVEQRYDEAVREIHSRWINYIESNYMVSNGMFSPEFISLRSILTAAICASNKRELSLDEINQLLERINKKIWVDGELVAFVNVPRHIDAEYLDQIVSRDYTYFRLCRDYNGIKMTSEANPSQLYFKWEIKSNYVLGIIKDFYDPEDNILD